MAFLGDLIVKMGADVSPFQSAMKKAKSITNDLRYSLNDIKSGAAVFAHLTTSIKDANTQMDRLNKGSGMLGAGLAGGIGGALTSGAMGIASSGVGFVKDMAVATVNLAADAETARITFEVLVGDAERGRKLFKDIEKFAARTSFDLGSASEAVKGLLAAGVGEGDVLSTMQLLGDLAMGDANKLGFLSKAYTDVMNKGKLQGQELRQFAENGVGLARALADTMGITVAEVTKLSEEGKISFGDVQTALASLTGEGGRFHGMMERINQTFTGQWNSLIEQIQTVGRDLGAKILPSLTSVVSETNKFLQGFMAIEEKGKFIGDLLDASVAVGIEAIQEHWDRALGEMVQKAWDAGKKIAMNLDPATAVARFAGGAVGKSIDGQNAAAGQTPLQAAQQQLADVLQRAKDAIPVAGAVKPLIDPAIGAAAAAKAAEGGKLKDAVSGLFDKLSPLAGKAIGAVQSKIESAKITGNWFKKTAENIFSGPKIKGAKDAAEKKDSRDMGLQFAGAMQRGSAEAYSTIVNAMRGNKDPQVKAIDKSTKAIVAAVKGNKQPQPKIVGAFA